MNDVIYLIMSGQEVHAAYLNEAEAEAACEEFKKLFVNLAPFEVYGIPLAPKLPAIGDGMFFWHVGMSDRTGTWVSKPERREGLVTGVVYPTGRTVWRCTVIAANEEDALKAGVEQINKYRSLQGTTHP